MSTVSGTVENEVEKRETCEKRKRKDNNDDRETY
jgi:hypothetical protein